jgi:parallel beta-helix repeat protein
LLIATPDAKAASEECRIQAELKDRTAFIDAMPDHALASLEHALACAANMARAGLANSFVIRVQPGEHHVDQPLQYPDVLRKQSASLTLLGPGATLVGSEPLKIESQESKGTEIRVRTRLPLTLASQASRGWVRNHGQYPDQAPPELIVNDRVFQVAREPNGQFISAIPHEKSGKELIFKANGSAGATGRVHVHGFLKYEWADSEVTASVAQDGSGNQVITLDDLPKYGVGENPYFILTGSSAFLDKATEYHVGENGDVELISEEPVSKISVTRSRGAIDFRNVENLVIDGLSFSGFRGYALRISGKNLRIKNIKVQNIGVNALEITGQDIFIQDSDFQDIGGMAIKAAGGNRQTLEPGNITIRDVHIRRIGRLIWSSVPAIRLDGVGNSVIDSKIEDAPHSGIFYFGNDHLISGNTLSRVAQITGDVGAIYTGRDLAGRGHKVIGNVINDVQGIGRHRATAIYVDDQSSGVLIEKNLIRDSYRGVLIGGGRDNIVRGNTFERVSECFKGDSRGIGSQREKNAVGGEIRKKLEEVPFRSPLYERRYPGISRILDDRYGLPVGNIVEGNVFSSCRWVISPEMLLNGSFQKPAPQK